MSPERPNKKGAQGTSPGSFFSLLFRQGWVTPAEYSKSRGVAEISVMVREQRDCRFYGQLGQLEKRAKNKIAFLYSLSEKTELHPRLLLTHSPIVATRPIFALHPLPTAYELLEVPMKRQWLCATSFPVPPSPIRTFEDEYSTENNISQPFPPPSN